MSTPAETEPPLGKLENNNNNASNLDNLSEERMKEQTQSPHIDPILLGDSNTKLVDASAESNPVSENDNSSGNLQDCIVHAPDLLGPMAENDPRRQACLNKATGMSDRLGIYYQVIPPGYRTSSPHAHSAEDELAFCLQGRGIVWQNGWTYPFVPGDVAGWKAGTGITHTIINDTKHVPGQSTNEEEEDLILLIVGENKPDQDKLFYPFDPEKYDVPGCKWEGPKPQNHWGQHPGCARAERPNEVLPEVQTGARPSNIINWQGQLAEVGQGELSAYATSLSQETGLSGRFGCNLEVSPPGTRSSDPHAHSVEDELVFVIQGEGSIWLDGHVFPVSPGDAIGYKGGVGIAHTTINESNASGDSGQDMVTWIVGENRRSEDRVVYPLHPEKRATFQRWWEDAPRRKLGEHPGRPTKPYDSR